jgi:hypothetical protein
MKKYSELCKNYKIYTRVLKVKYHKNLTANYSKLTIVHEWLFKTSMAQQR